MPHEHSYQSIVDDLLTRLGASRITLRLEYPDHGLSANDVIAEATRPGVRSLKGPTSLDQWAAETVQHLQRTLRPLIQSDAATAHPAPPPELLSAYGVRAQMLGPIVRDGVLRGWISVHHNEGPRDWTDADLAVLDDGVTRVHERIGGPEWQISRS